MSQTGPRRWEPTSPHWCPIITSRTRDSREILAQPRPRREWSDVPSRTKWGSSMDTLNLAGASGPNSLSKWIAPAGGFFAAVVVTALFCRLPPPHPVTWSGLIGSAAMRVLAVLLASAATISGLRRVWRDAVTATARRPVVQTSLDSLWLAPLALFLCERSLWAMPLAALLVASVTKSLYALQNCPGASENGDWLILSPTGNIFGMPDSSPWIWRLCSACSAVLCVEAGVIAGVSGYPIIAAIMVGAGSAVLTWLAVEAHARSRPSRVAADSPSRILVALALAIVLTAAGLTRYMTHTHHWGGMGNPSATNSRHGFSPIERHGQVGREKTAEELSSEFAEAHPGVLLWPRNKPTRLPSPRRPCLVAACSAIAAVRTHWSSHSTAFTGFFERRISARPEALVRFLVLRIGSIRTPPTVLHCPWRHIRMSAL